MHQPVSSACAERRNPPAVGRSRRHLPGLPQDRRPLGPTACCPTSAPWAAIAATPSPPSATCRLPGQEVRAMTTPHPSPTPVRVGVGRRPPHPDPPARGRRAAGHLALAGLQAGPLRPPAHHPPRRPRPARARRRCCAASNKKASPRSRRGAWSHDPPATRLPPTSAGSATTTSTSCWSSSPSPPSPPWSRSPWPGRSCRPGCCCGSSRPPAWTAGRWWPVRPAGGWAP